MISNKVQYRINKVKLEALVSQLLKEQGRKPKPDAKKITCIKNDIRIVTNSISNLELRIN